MSTPAKPSADLTNSSSFAETNRDLSRSARSPSEQRIENAVQSVIEDTHLQGVDESRFLPHRLFEPSEYLPSTESLSAKANWWRPTVALVFAGLAYIVLGDDLRFRWASAGSPALAQQTGYPVNLEVAKLVVMEATPMPMDQPAPLGVSVDNANELNILELSGLPKGTTLSSGISTPDDGWLLFASDSKDAVIRPPPHFIGVMELTVSLIVAPGVNADRSKSRSLRFEWAAKKIVEANLPEEMRPEAKVQDDALSVAKMQDETSPASKSRSQTTRQLSSEETAALLKRGNELVLSGDIAAARLVLRRAAEAGNARAAFLLAGTYNPITLDELRVHGLSPDLAIARHWYEKARELGSQEASRELQILTIRRN